MKLVMTIFVCDLRWVYANLVEVSIVGISYAKFCDWCWLRVINLSLTQLHLMIYRLTIIHINIYYGGPLSNANPYDGFPFQGSGIQCYYKIICYKLKTLNDLKIKIMEELQMNLLCITYILLSILHMKSSINALITDIWR